MKTWHINSKLSLKRKFRTESETGESEAQRHPTPPYY